MTKTKTIELKAEDVIGFNPKTGKIYIGDYEMTEAEGKNLQEEVKFLESTKLWQIWQNTIKRQVIDVGIYDSKTFEDLRTAKAFLKVLAVLQDINTIIKSFKPKEPLPAKPIEPIEH